MNLRRKIFMATTAGLVAVGAGGGAFATSGGKRGEDAAEIAAVMSARISLAEAVQYAEAEAKGRAIQAGMEDEDGRALYEVKVVAGDGIAELYIDPANGKVDATEKEGFVAGLIDDLEGSQARLAETRTDLATAIGAAELAADGKAFEADIETEKHASSPVIEVEVARADGTTVEVRLDSASGQVLATGPASEHEDDGGGDRE